MIAVSVPGVVDLRTVTFEKQLVADIYQAMARAKLDALTMGVLIKEFQQIRQNRERKD